MAWEYSYFSYRCPDAKLAALRVCRHAVGSTRSGTLAVGVRYRFFLTYGCCRRGFGTALGPILLVRGSRLEAMFDYVDDSRSAHGALPVRSFCLAVVMLCRQKEEALRKQAIKDKKTAAKQKQEVKPALTVLAKLFVVLVFPHSQRFSSDVQ